MGGVLFCICKLGGGLDILNCKCIEIVDYLEFRCSENLWIGILKVVGYGVLCKDYFIFYV